ncbi:Fluoroacetate dehalogenase [Pigmentiphaga humi]|uniref:Fluoroacetate dehalogenase n=1 Tax=Pigmentiphaga humi TaxID=2478468 RepID=A0A3P4B1T8_9BURK|nr:alpha/beta hydrolase [Pigmentiphaga humi]VCU70022.1 Fluoroacetate dehalogenase [Pigmentiphaga humi]
MAATPLFALPVARHRVNGVEIAARMAGSGPALLLLHGHPQTHAMWHKLWPALTRHFSCVAMDLRGYGDSGIPADEPAGHAAFSKRELARDAVALMRELGHERFHVLAHDRGARVAHRLALDHPQRIERMMLLDIAPTLDMYEGTTRGFAQAYYHWFLLTQPAPLPERLIGADPAFYVRSIMGGRHAGLAPFTAEALAEYERCARHAHWPHAICEDYRAAAAIDLEHDRADRARGLRIACPLRVLWGGKGVVGRYFDVLGLWRPQAEQVDGRPLDCGHYIAEEAPEVLWEEVRRFWGIAG